MVESQHTFLKPFFTVVSRRTQATVLHRIALCGCLASAVVVWAPLAGVHAATLTWDATTGTGGPEDGSGTWANQSATFNNWWSGSQQQWNNATPDSAVFGVTSGTEAYTVTVSSTITAVGITFANQNYTLTSGTLRINGGGITANANATINSVVALGAFQGWSVANGSTLTLGNTVSGSFNGGATIAKNGLGTLVLSGAVSLGKPTAFNSATLNVNQGTVIVGGAGSMTLTNSWAEAGSASGTTGVLTVKDSASLTATSGLNVGELGQGVLNVSGTANVQGMFFVGKGGANTFGILNQSGGTITNNHAIASSNPDLDLGTTSGGVGVYNLSSGTLNATAVGLRLGYNTFGGNNNAGTGIVNQQGGLVNALTVTLGTGTSAGRSSTAVYNLLGGTLQTGSVTKATSGTTTFNFDGGTLKANASGTLMSGIDNAFVRAGGATLDTGTFTVTVSQNLSAPSGTGVSSIALTSVGTGYYGTPLVTISGGGGTGATAYATVDAAGTVTGITVTNPGTGYTSTPTVTLTGGGGSGVTIGTINLAANISGGLTKLGSGTLTLSGSNSYAGATGINAGVLALGSTNALSGGGNVTFGGGTLRYGSGITTDLSGRITSSGGAVAIDTGSNGLITFASPIDSSNVGGLTKSGTGTLTLSAANTYTGATTISGGTLALTGAGALADTVAVNTAASGAGFDISGITASSLTIGSLSGSTGSVVTLGDRTLSAGDATSTTFAGGIVGSGGLTKTGAGTLTLSAANTYTGTTTISGGTLALAGAGALAVTGAVNTAASGAALDVSGITASSLTIGSLSGSTGSVVTLGGKTLTAGDATSTTFAGGIAGAGGGLTKTGAGTLTLSAANTYTGTTTISGGTLALTGAGALAVTGAVNATASGAAFDVSGITASSLTIGSLSGSTGSVVTLGGKTLTAGDATSTTFAGGIAGAGGGLTKTGSGTLTLSGSNSYTGATRINAGILALGSMNALSGGGNVTFGGGTLQYGSGITIDFSGRIKSSGSAVAIDTNGQSVTFASPIDNTNTAGFRKLGSGTLTLAATQSYGSTTTVSAGVLQIGNGSTAGRLNGNAVSVASGATLAFNRTDTYGGNVANVISGAGGITIAGGTLTLTGANTFTGGITANGGTLSIANTLANNATNTVTVNSGATLSFARTDTFANSGGTVVTPIVIASGGLVTNVANIFNNLGPITMSGGTLAPTGALTVSGKTYSFALQGGVTATGGATSTISGSFISLGTGGASLNSTTFTVAAGSTLAVSAGFIDGPSLAWPDSVPSNLVKTGPGTMTLTGSNVYTGTTSVQAGILRIGNGGTTGSIVGSPVSVGNGAVLAFNRIDNYGGSIASVISGSGGVRVESGFLDLLGLNTYTGATDVLAGGTLAINGSLANASLTVASGATLMGSGTIAGLTTIAGMHRPGNSPGVETFANLTYNAGATIQWELWNNTASNSPLAFDQIVVNGDLTFSGATTLDLVFTGSAGPSNFSTVAWANSFWDSNQEWMLYDVAAVLASANNLTLTVTNWQDSTGALFQTARPDASFKVEQRGNDVYVVYAAVPEPGSLALAGIGLLAAGWAASRKRRPTWLPHAAHSGRLRP